MLASAGGGALERTGQWGRRGGMGVEPRAGRPPGAEIRSSAMANEASVRDLRTEGRALEASLQSLRDDARAFVTHLRAG